ncbi:unnamed protein product [Rotaria sp. Silwood2]|nr:unnamed protein product [Rotaria sp. Silwood2]
MGCNVYQYYGENRDPQDAFKIAELYVKKKDYATAMEWYDKENQLINTSKINLFNYANTNRLMGEYQKALDGYLMYAALTGDVNKVMDLANQCEKILKSSVLSYNYKLENYTYNTSANETNIAVLRTNPIYVSVKNENSNEEKPSYDIYQVVRDFENFAPPVKAYNKGIPKLFVTSLSYTQDGNDVVFSARDEKSSSKKGKIKNERIYLAENLGGSFLNVKPFPFNIEGYSIKNPSYNTDGTAIYFSSNQPGGSGGFDIWESDLVKGKWTTPKNLGKLLNSTTDEINPFVQQDGKDNTIYFSSDRDGGFGGFDVYAAKKTNNTWQGVEMQPAPINSAGDDVSVIYDDEIKTGYVSSNRMGGKGGFDVYRFTPFNLKLIVNTNDTFSDKFIDYALVQVFDGGEKLFEGMTNETGKAVFQINKDKNYTLKISKDNYRPIIQKINSNGKESGDSVMALALLKPDAQFSISKGATNNLSLDNYIIFTGKVIDAATNKPAYTAKMRMFINKNGPTGAIINTDLNQPITQKKIDSLVNVISRDNPQLAQTPSKKVFVQNPAMAATQPETKQEPVISLVKEKIDTATTVKINVPKQEDIVSAPKEEVIVAPKQETIISAPKKEVVVDVPKAEESISTPKIEDVKKDELTQAIETTPEVVKAEKKDTVSIKQITVNKEQDPLLAADIVITKKSKKVKVIEQKEKEVVPINIPEKIIEQPKEVVVEKIPVVVKAESKEEKVIIKTPEVTAPAAKIEEAPKPEIKKEVVLEKTVIAESLVKAKEVTEEKKETPKVNTEKVVVVKVLKNKDENPEIVMTTAAKTEVAAPPVDSLPDVYYKIQLATVIAFSFATAKAQSQFTTNEVRQFMSKGEQNGIEIILNGTKPEDAKDAIEKWGKKMHAKIVRDKKNPEIFIDNAQIPTVSANVLDMYAVVTPVDNGSKVTIYTDLGGAFVSSAAYGTQYAGLEAAIKKFAKDQAIVVVEDQQKAEEKTLKTLNGDLKDLVGKKADYLKDIEKAKALIQQREQDIVKNDADQGTKQQQISLQQQIIETVKTKRATLN